jgi:hypothetical protein
MDDVDLVVEIHVPLTRTRDIPDDEDPYPWIDDVMVYLEDAEDRGDARIIDEGEEFGDAFVFSVADGTEPQLLAIAAGVAALPGIPTGVFAIVTDDLADAFGAGRRVELA